MTVKTQEKPDVLRVTEAAKARIASLVEKADKPIAGVRLTVKTVGCNGMKYDIQYVEEPIVHDEVVELDDGNKIFVDPMAIMFIVGSEMDWTEDKFESKFTFSNPNETARCGCGESFSVDPKPS